MVGGEASATRLGAYRIERLLGEGAMGDVYLAIHEALGRRVAIKTLKPAVAADRSMTERFFAEARAVNIIHHENIVECTDLVSDPDGKTYIVMELLEGRTLGAAIRDVGHMPARRAVRIAAQIADALGAAHDKGIVHRDLKPDNVFLIKRAGSPDYVKVLDFGMARLRPDLAGGATATQSGALIGTPAYMSPEQARGERATAAADIYALGAVVFHMLTGQMPFSATSVSLMLVAVLQETPVRVDRIVADIPSAVGDVVARALAKDPAARPATMAAFRRELLEAVGLPIDVAASVIDASARDSVTPAALAATLHSDVTGPAGQSSLSAAAAEVHPARSGRRRWPYLAGATVAVAVAIGLTSLGSGGDATPRAGTAQSVPTPAPLSTPMPTPAQAPTRTPTVSTEPTDTQPAPTPVAAASAPGSAAPAAPPVSPRPTPSPAPSHPLLPRPSSRPATTTLPATGSASSAEPATGSAAVAPEPQKVDRTKQLVGPKPPTP